VQAAFGGSAQGVARTGDLALYGAGRTLYIDGIGPDGLQPVGALLLPGPATSLAAAGSLAAVGQSRGLVLVDIGDPAHPRLVGDLEAPDQVDPLAAPIVGSAAVVEARE
jgi:hypothetical protein